MSMCARVIDKKEKLFVESQAALHIPTFMSLIGTVCVF